MFEGFSTWVIRDLLLVIGVIFSAGGVSYMLCNHMKHFNTFLKEDMPEIKNRLRTVETDVAWIKGKLESTD